MVPVILDPAKAVIHAGSLYEPVVTTPLVAVAAFPLIEPTIVLENVLIPATV
jgi:hypothetical protein